MQSAAAAMLLLGLMMIPPMREGSAGTSPRSILVTNSVDVTAYPVSASGDAAPIALTTDMVSPTAMATDADGRLYVTNSATNTVAVYAANSNGNVPPLAIIGGSKTRISNPLSIALDAHENIYVLNAAGRGSITVYPPIAFSSGILNEAPTATIAGNKTRFKSPSGIAVDSHGAIYVTNELGGSKVKGQPNDRGSVTIYPSGSNGNTAPIATIGGAASGLSFPLGIVLDAKDNIYVSNQATANSETYYPSITVYAAGSAGNATPTATISGSNTSIVQSGIAVDSDRNIYALGYVSNVGSSIGFFRAGSNGNVSPSTTIVGANTELTGPNALALDSIGNLYALNNYTAPNRNPRITIYSAGSTGDAAPIATITSAFTGLASASGIAVESGSAGGTRGDIYVANESGGPQGTGSVTIYPPDGYATDSPIATIAGDQTGLEYPYHIALDPDGNIFVLNQEGEITEYAAGSSGNAGPTASMMIDAKETTYPTGIAVDGRKIYIANHALEECGPYGGDCHQIGWDNIEIFQAQNLPVGGSSRWGEGGSNSPSAVITGFNTQLASPSAISVDGNGTIYVTNEGLQSCTGYVGRIAVSEPATTAVAGSITIYAPGSSGNVAPIAMISGPHTGLGSPYAIALDASENLYVLNTDIVGCASVNGGRGGKGHGGRRGVNDLAPTQLDSGPVTQGILVFAAGSSGDVAPIAAIGGPFTGMYSPGGIAILPAQP